MPALFVYFLQSSLKCTFLLHFFVDKNSNFNWSKIIHYKIIMEHEYRTPIGTLLPIMMEFSSCISLYCQEMSQRVRKLEEAGTCIEIQLVNPTKVVTFPLSPTPSYQKTIEQAKILLNTKTPIQKSYLKIILFCCSAF